MALLSEYDGVLREFLQKVQDEPDSDLIAKDDDVLKNYSLFRSFRKCVEGRARSAGLSDNVQNAMNR